MRRTIKLPHKLSSKTVAKVIIDKKLIIKHKLQTLPVHFELSGGQTHDIKHAESLVNHSPASGFVIADKGYDSEAFREIVKQKGATPVIPYRKNSLKSDKRIDNWLYRYRH